MEKRLNKFIAEVRAGLREGSVVTTTTVGETLESEDVWAQLRRELEDVGISGTVVQENQPYITQWLKTAISSGILEEAQPPGTLEVPRLSVPNSADSGYGGSSTGGRSSYAPSLISMAAANEGFEEDLRRHPSRVALVEKSSAPVEHTVKARKASTISSVLFKYVSSFKNGKYLLTQPSDSSRKKPQSSRLHRTAMLLK